MRGIYVVSTLVAILIVSATYLTHTRSGHEIAASESTEKTKEEVLLPQQPLAATASAPPQILPPKAARLSSRLVEDFKNTFDWRAFALSAQARPEEGGYFYGLLVSDICGIAYLQSSERAASAINSASHKNGTISIAAIRMTEDLSKKCASFAPGEAEELHRIIKRKSLDQKDPIVNAQTSLADALRTGEPQTVQKKLSAVFDLEDPLAPHSNSLLLRTITNASKDMIFDGKTYNLSNPQDQAVLLMALDLAPCSGGVHCELNTQMTLACLGGQFCTDKATEFLRQRYVNQEGLSEAQFNHALELSKRIQQAIAVKETSAFTGQ